MATDGATAFCEVVRAHEIRTVCFASQLCLPCFFITVLLPVPPSLLTLVPFSPLLRHICLSHQQLGAAFAYCACVRRRLRVLCVSGTRWWKRWNDGASRTESSRVETIRGTRFTFHSSPIVDVVLVVMTYLTDERNSQADA